MVIAPGKDGIVAYIMLHAGEKLPHKWNTERTVVWLMDRGRVVATIKDAGEILSRDSEYLVETFPLTDNSHTVILGPDENEEKSEINPADGG